jgi:hypothetical protein
MCGFCLHSPIICRELYGIGFELKKFSIFFFFFFLYLYRGYLGGTAKKLIHRRKLERCQCAAFVCIVQSSAVSYMGLDSIKEIFYFFFFFFLYLYRGGT